MARAVIGVNDPKAVKKYSTFLAIDSARKSYWTKRFMGVGEEASMPIQMLKDLEATEGEYISFDLLMQMRMQPVEGDEVLENREEDMKFYTDGVYIDQMRCGINTGGKMSRKRTIHKLRKRARRLQTDWWARVFDELFFMYASGARGINPDFVYPTTYQGFAGNALTAPDGEHIHYANGKADKASIAVGDKMTVREIDKAVAVASMMGGGAGGGVAGTDGNTQTPSILPISVDGEEHYVMLMNPWQVYDLRQAAGSHDWLELQKAAAGAVGRKSPIFLGTLGMHNGVVMHQHKALIRFNDYGGASVEACRALFLGEQAMVVAFGSPGKGLRFGWNEETRDNGNQVVITSGTIAGFKKVTYNGKDYGQYVVDTAAASPV